MVTMLLTIALVILAFCAGFARALSSLEDGDWEIDTSQTRSRFWLDQQKEEDDEQQ